MAKPKKSAKRAPRKPAAKRPRVDIFERFGIKSLSPSQLQKFAQDPGLWFLSARKKIWEDAGPAAWRGEAVEAALYAHMMGRPAGDVQEAMGKAFAVRLDDYLIATGGEITDGFEAAVEKAKVEADRALPRAIAAVEAMALPAPTLYNQGCEAWLPGITVPVYGKPDFCLTLTHALTIGMDAEGYPIEIPAGERVSLDLKTTGQLPTEIKPDHGISTSCYALARKERFALTLYVSTAEKPRIPHRLHVLDETQMRRFIIAASETAHRLADMLKAAAIVARYRKRDPEDVLAQMCRPNLLAKGGGTFDLWKDDYAARGRDAVAAWR